MAATPGDMGQMTTVDRSGRADEAPPNAGNQSLGSSALPNPGPIAEDVLDAPGARRVWFGTVVTAALVLAFAPLPAYDYDRYGLNIHRETPIRLWWAQATGVHAGRLDGVATVAFVALLVAFMALTAWVLWYALQPEVVPGGDRQGVAESSGGDTDGGIAAVTLVPAGEPISRLPVGTTDHPSLDAGTAAPPPDAATPETS